MKTLAPLAVALGLLSVACAREVLPLKAVTVRDAEFKVVKELTASELTDFEARWKDKTEVPVNFESVGGTHYKLDIAGGPHDGRWLYQTTGYTMHLDPKVHPVLKVRDPEQFNRLIGAQPK